MPSTQYTGPTKDQIEETIERMKRSLHHQHTKDRQDKDHLVLMPAGSKTPVWLAQIPKQSAFTREETKDIVSQSVARALEVDRQHRPEDGWVQRADARVELIAHVALELREQHVPGDAYDSIIDALYRRFKQWVDHKE